MKWWLVMLVGFVIAVTPTIMFQVWNGASLFGLCVCMLAAGFILREADDV